MMVGIGAFLFSLLLAPASLFANPYLAKPGERPASLRISTCAVSGGFIHLYTAINNGLFDKYGLKFEHIYIGSPLGFAALHVKILMNCLIAHLVPFLFTICDKLEAGLFGYFRRQLLPL